MLTIMKNFFKYFNLNFLKFAATDFLNFIC